MTRLLEEAISALRDLPEDEQDAAADALFVYISSDERRRDGKATGQRILNARRMTALGPPGRKDRRQPSAAIGALAAGWRNKTPALPPSF
jgi:hypothetical protein